MPGVLYLVATPIGNLEDISARAVKILQVVDLIVCEDKRVTIKLLAHLGIAKNLFSLHQHSDDKDVAELVSKLNQGFSLAYVTDAGTPGVADPGGKLVAAVALQNIQVVPIPGPSALAAAISVAGINLQEFAFLGWPPHKKGRQTFFKQVAEAKIPVIFFESTHRIVKALEELNRLAPERHLVVCRELTKKFETIYRGTSQDILSQLNNSSTKGEFVVIVNKVIEI
ncbi:TPA: 16S rRNA (cytidine(1402)-2'-O)-methyltransferase [Patescibacteria group bacterium]|nr:MAG: Ribosomal RNA small subunit methyltransferase I [Parcubacteria group bacterium GW2011_GWA2_46_39]HBV33448.1 16S rRNA (cytidine(1402)-2'-O)-methyltransferase [Patescibacteria group bacterium]HCU47462.1 16S rRNA (cytidine(1402)-2'-O)-methyltransferase [Patescibacteria group bacterium]